MPKYVVKNTDSFITFIGDEKDCEIAKTRINSENYKSLSAEYGCNKPFILKKVIINDFHENEDNTFQSLIISENKLNDKVFKYAYDCYGDYVYECFIRYILEYNYGFNPNIIRQIAIVKCNRDVDHPKVLTNQDKVGCKLIRQIILKKGMTEIIRILKQNDTTSYIRYASGYSITDILFPMFESSLSIEERNKLKDTDFGIPKERKYPLIDKEHVKLAIKMFNHCETKDEKTLASNITVKMGKLFTKSEIEELKTHVGKTNRFKKYI